MNVFERIFFIFNSACGLALGAFISKHYGLGYGLLAIPAGFIGGITFLKCIRAMGWLWYKFFPLRPICRKGLCRSRDYQLAEVTEKGSVFMCKCGDKFLRTGKLFCEISPDGTPRPYMRYKGLRLWKPC